MSRVKFDNSDVVSCHPVGELPQSLVCQLFDKIYLCSYWQSTHQPWAKIKRKLEWNLLFLKSSWDIKTHWHLLVVTENITTRHFEIKDGEFWSQLFSPEAESQNIFHCSRQSRWGEVAAFRRLFLFSPPLPLQRLFLFLNQYFLWPSLASQEVPALCRMENVSFCFLTQKQTFTWKWILYPFHETSLRTSVMSSSWMQSWKKITSGIHSRNSLKWIDDERYSRGYIWLDVVDLVSRGDSHHVPSTPGEVHCDSLDRLPETMAMNTIYSETTKRHYLQQ